MYHPPSPAYSEETLSDEENSIVSPKLKWMPRSRPKVYLTPMPMKSQKALEEGYIASRAKFRNVTFSEIIAYITEDADKLLEVEEESICADYFRYSVIQHNDFLVEFYTGLKNASQFSYISSILLRRIFVDYDKWDTREKIGFLTHTLMVLMKLRLNMTDEELGARFKIQPYVVNMSLRLWLPAMNSSIYLTCQDVYRFPVPFRRDEFTKVVDIVEFCHEVPDAIRTWRDELHDRRKAVLAVRSDGFVCFAGHISRDHKPDEVVLQESGLKDHSATNMDLFLTQPEHYNAVSSMGIICRRMTKEGAALIEGASHRMSQYRILAGIPPEYASFDEYIYPVCAALSNFSLPGLD